MTLRPNETFYILYFFIDILYYCNVKAGSFSELFGSEGAELQTQKHVP